MENIKKDKIKEFGKAVKIRLIELEMTQNELANLTGIDHRYISFILNGKCPGWKHREKIRAILGMPSPKKQVNG